MATWLHLPEISINLDRVAFITPQSDGLFVLNFASFDSRGEQTKIIIDGNKAKALCKAIGRPLPFTAQTARPAGQQKKRNR